MPAVCEECNEALERSYLLRKFNHPVCDSCRESRGKHNLMTRTSAKQEYLLKDVDLNRERPLDYIVKNNPHHPRWGEMRLYLKLQVEQRAFEVWGGEENFRNECQKREAKREKMMRKRMNMSQEDESPEFLQEGLHVHTFGHEMYDEDDDVYTRTCTSCGYENTYDKDV